MNLVVNPSTKFEVSDFTRYEDMHGSAKSRKGVIWGGVVG